jgi:hypothetical protein
VRARPRTLHTPLPPPRETPTPSTILPILLAFLTRVCLSCALAASSFYDYSNFDAIFAVSFTPRTKTPLPSLAALC